MNNIKSLFRTGTPIAWNGAKVSGLAWISESIQAELRQSPVGRALQESLQSLQTKYLGQESQLCKLDAVGNKTLKADLLRSYITPVLQSLQSLQGGGSASQDVQFPAKVLGLLKMMDLELVKWALENPQLKAKDINLARSNLIVNFLFTRGLGPLVTHLENPENKQLLGFFSASLNRELNQGAGKFLQNLLVQATNALPLAVKQQFIARMSAGLQTPRGAGVRGAQTRETGDRPGQGKKLRPGRRSMEMLAQGTDRKAKKQVLRAFETSLREYGVAEPFLALLKEHLQQLDAAGLTRLQLCQATIEYIPAYIKQLDTDKAGLDAALSASQVSQLQKLQTSLQEEISPSEMVQMSLADLDELDHILSGTLMLDDAGAESDKSGEAPAPATEKTEKEKN